MIFVLNPLIFKYHALFNFLQNTGDNGATKPALLILGNKADKEAERVVATRSARQLAEDYKVHFAEVSALAGTGVEKVS
jgi:hypothetical protein